MVSLGNACRERRAKNLSQRDVAEAIGISQTLVSRLEQGQLEDRDLERSYHDAVRRLRAVRKRVGRRPGRKARPVNVHALRGVKLLDEDMCAESLPTGWKLLFLTRISRDSELGMIYEPDTDDFGLVAFRAAAGKVIPGDIIRFEEEYDGPANRAYKALAAFCNDRLPENIRQIYLPTK